MLPHFLTQHPSDTTTLPSAQQPKSIRVSQAAFISSASVAKNAGSPRSASIFQWEKFKRNLSAFFVRNVSIPLAKLFAINRAIATVSNNTDSQVNVHINATINNKGEQAIDHYKKALEIVKTPLNLLHLQGSFDFQEPSASRETELGKLSIGIIKQRLSQFSLDSLRENFFPKLDLEDLRDLYDATYSLPLDRENAEKLDQLNKYLNQAIAERTFSLSVKTFLNSAEKPAGDNTPNIEVDYQKLQNVAKAYLNAKRENINLEQLPEFQRLRTFMQQKIKEIDLLRSKSPFSADAFSKHSYINSIR